MRTYGELSSRSLDLLPREGRLLALECYDCGLQCLRSRRALSELCDIPGALNTGCTQGHNITAFTTFNLQPCPLS